MLRKFYVVCGNQTALVLANDQWEACHKAIKLWPGGELADWFYVSEAGYRFDSCPLYLSEPIPYAINTDTFIMDYLKDCE